MRLKARSPPLSPILAHRRTSAAATIGSLLGMIASGNTRLGSDRFGEVRRPVVVDLVGPRAHLAGGDEVVDHQAAVDDLGVHAVAVQVGQPQLGRGRPRLGARPIVPLEADGLHLVDAGEGARRVLEEAGAHAVPHALVLGVHEPVAAVLQLLHARDEQLPLGRRLRRPEVGRAVGEIDVVVAGDQPILRGHGGSLASRVLAGGMIPYAGAERARRRHAGGRDRAIGGRA